MYEVFVDDETGYLNWLAGHPNGYVINIGRDRQRTAYYPTLHRAGCNTIARVPPGNYTTENYIKVCSDSVAGLATWISQHVNPGDGGFQRMCGTCNPDGACLTPILPRGSSSGIY